MRGTMTFARARIVQIEPVQRRREAIGVALAPHLSVREDVESGQFHVTNRQQRGIVLRLLQPLFIDPPQVARANSRRHLLAKLVSVDKPVRLRVRTN
jgi:hypothetical protein